MTQKEIIIDCDAGTDDAVALIILIAAHKLRKIKIKAITCVYGNTTIYNVVKNVFRTLQVCKVYDIPVFQGVHSSLLRTQNAHIASDDDYHGKDGFGDVYADEPDTSKLEKEHAVYALNKIVSSQPGNISLICLGPLTNIAMTIKMYPEFIDNIKELFIMGGNSTAQGNVTAQAEFNFYADPESVHIVLNNNNKPLWLLPWETCTKPYVSFEWRREVFGRIKTPCVKLLNEIEEGATCSRTKPVLHSHYKPCDAFLAAIILRPDMAENIVSHHADIELHGTRTRGQVVLDHLLCNKPNILLIQAMNGDIFKKILLFAADPSEENSCLT